MRKTFVLLPLALILSFAGLSTSWMLLVKHVAKKTGMAWFDSQCGATEDSEDNCNDVLASEYGTFPPIPPDVDIEKRGDPRIVWGRFSLVPRPVALFGLMYFLALTGWYVAIGRPRYRQRYWHLLPIALNLIGVAGSANFIYIMATKLDVWCPWCVVSHTINFFLLFVTVMLWPTKPPVAVAEVVEPQPDPVDPTSEQDGSSAPTGPAEAAIVEPTSTIPVGHPVQRLPHPTLRLVMVTFMGIIAATSAYSFFYDYLMAQNRVAALDRSLEAVRNHASTLYAMYVQNPKNEIPNREGDPVRGGGSIDLRVVLFSDFQCPHCRSFAHQMEEQIEPLFDGHLKLIFKHFPASKACEPRLRDAHPYACAAAKASEAARTLGGNESFWKAHDLLFASGHKLKNFDYKILAEQLELDPEKFTATMQSPEVIARIREDIQLGLDIGVSATPAMFISGRQVPRIAKSSPVFWKEAKKRFDRIVAAHLKAEAAKEEANQTGPPGSAKQEAESQPTQEQTP